MAFRFFTRFGWPLIGLLLVGSGCLLVETGPGNLFTWVIILPVALTIFVLLRFKRSAMSLEAKTVLATLCDPELGEVRLHFDVLPLEARTDQARIVMAQFGPDGQRLEQVAFFPDWAAVDSFIDSDERIIRAQ